MCCSCRLSINVYENRYCSTRLYNDGMEVDGYSIDGYSYIEEGDVLIKGLKEYSSNSLGTVVFARVLKDSNRKHPYDPIYALEKVLEEYKRLKLEVRVGVEPGFYVVKPTENGLIKPADNAGYIDTSESDLVRRIRLQTAEILNDVGVFIEKHHHEVGPGQCEINFKHSDPLSTSMNFLLLKHVVKRVASDHGVQVTFMPKPFYEYPGNGLHVHISLWRDDENLFYDSDYVLSDIGLYFMEGTLKYARPLTAFLAQTINSYRCLKPGFEAPVVISWGRNFKL